MKFLKVVFFLVILNGCAAKTVKIDQVVEANKNNSAKALEGGQKFRLDYLIHENSYSYSTFEIEDNHRYFQLLTENGKILAASEISIRTAYSPSIRECTLFPYHDDLDVSQCLLSFNARVLKSHDPKFVNELIKVNEVEKSKNENERTGAIAFSAILSPILVPVAILSSPLMIYDYKSSENQRKKFHLKLGENKNLKSYLQSLEPKYLSENNNSGTAYLESGVLNEPEVAFGFFDDNVIWIQRDPVWVCGGGFMFWGLKCTVGFHKDQHW